MRDRLDQAGPQACLQAIFLSALIDVARATLKVVALFPGFGVLDWVRGEKDGRDLAMHALISLDF